MRTALLIAIASLALALPASANAAPPANDAFAAATDISSLPFSDSVDLDGASSEAGEPIFCNFKTRSVWYRFTPSVNTPVTIDMFGSSPGIGITLWRSFGGIGNLSFEGCLFGGSTTLNAQGGGVYYIQAGDASSGSVFLNLAVSAVPPPPNDAFASPRSVGSLPFSDTVPMLASTVEPGEPTPSGLVSFQGTAWWTFTAPESRSMLITQIGCCGDANVGVYTGNDLGSLVEVPVVRAFGRTVFRATGGQEYRIQLGHNGLFSSGELGIAVDRTPNPSATIFYNPFDPSSLDSVQFFASSFDPAAIGIDSWNWDFGDGETGTGQIVSHRYLEDGDYEVTLTVGTPDGRTAATTRTISIRTHDVGISKVLVPQAASAGQTRSISVSVVSSRYDEMVTVTLYRSVPEGFVPVGSLSQSVQVRKRSTPFAFSYTFTADDAAVGKVTFKAVATINGARDALPADNEIVSLPTKVN